MNKIYKRIISMIITFLMIVTMIPMSSISASAANKIDSHTITKVKAGQSIVVQTDKFNLLGLWNSKVYLYINYNDRPEFVPWKAASTMFGRKLVVTVREYPDSKSGKKQVKKDYFPSTGKITNLGKTKYVGWKGNPISLKKANQKYVITLQVTDKDGTLRQLSEMIDYDFAIVIKNGKIKDEIVYQTNSSVYNYTVGRLNYTKKNFSGNYYFDDGSYTYNGTKYKPIYKVGSYSIESNSLNVRTGPGTGYGVLSSIPKGTNVAVTQVKNGWGYVADLSGWISLNYCTYLGPTITKPAAPTVTLVSLADMPVGESAQVSWNDVYDAKYYSAYLYDSNGSIVKEYHDIYGTTAYFPMEKEGVYTVKVIAQNNVYSSDPGVLPQNITVHGKSKVTYLDDDGNVIGTQDVSYGKNSVAPIPPEKIGYTFKGWSDTLTNIRGAKTVKAEYNINEYTVQFTDYNGKVLKSEKVKYLENATPPEVVQAPENYKFCGWDSEKYKNVYNEDKSEPIKVSAVYEWINADIPIICKAASAKRQNDGYYVKFNLENYPNARTRGRAIVTLKTANGKMVWSTESAAFSLDKSEKKENMEVFIPCETAASKAEIVVVSSFSSGSPISLSSSVSVDNGLMWSDWSTDRISNPDYTEESRKEYHFRDKIFSTGTTTIKNGWIYTGTYNSYENGWSGWSDSVVDTAHYYDKNGVEYKWRDVKTQWTPVYASRTKYNYHHYYRGVSSGYSFYWAPYWQNSTPHLHSISLNYALGVTGESNAGGYRYGYAGCGQCNGGNYWYYDGTSTETYEAGQKQQYSYNDHYNIFDFYKWSDYSEWSTTQYTESNTRHVEERTVYRYKSQSAMKENESGIDRTYSGIVDGVNPTMKTEYIYYRYYNPSVKRYSPTPLSGYTRYEETIVESQLAQVGISIVDNKTPYYKIDGYEGFFYFKCKYEYFPEVKQVTLYVFKGKEPSDYNNVYVGQTTTDGFGKYSFSYKLSEEPTSETGDFTVAIGVEGRDSLQTVDIIKAPKETYTVNYYNREGEIISSQKVLEGESAVAPDCSDLEENGYTFVCWNATATNVTHNMDISPIYTQNTYTVIFIDWRNQVYETRFDYHYGDPIFRGENKDDGISTTVEDCDSGKAKGWDAVLDDQLTVTSNMVITAAYDTRTYSVKYYDYDGTLLDSQTVEYDGATESPELPESDDIIYFDWDIEKEDVMNVKEDIAVGPVYTFAETAPIAKASVSTGVYDSAQTVTLSCEDENAVIYYTLDGSDPQGNVDAIQYTEPITISSTATLSYYTTSFGKNDSNTESCYYVIGNDGYIVNTHNDIYDDETDTILVKSMKEYASLAEESYSEEGRSLDGFYYDTAYTQKADFDKDTFGNIVELYVKHTLNTYNVSFKDSTGNVISTAKVSYGASAEPPKMDDLGDMIFCGWNGDTSFISEDTVFEPVYKNQADIVNVSLDKTSYSLDAGYEFKLTATITPDSKKDIEVIWATENSNVATVSDDGTVTAVGKGQTKIYVATEDLSGYAECIVTVGSNPNTSICLNKLSTLDIDSQGYLRRIPVSKDNTNTVEFVASQFDNASAALKFIGRNGVVLESTDLVGTGTVIYLISGGKAIDSITVVMTGDINGDGKVNMRDVAYLSRSFVKKENIDEIQSVAADVNGDGKVNNRDAAMMAQFVVDKIKVIK